MENNIVIGKEYPLQSAVFGHRFKQSQTIYEYLLEFLIVTFSKKEDVDDKDDLFPLSKTSKDKIEFQPNNNIALKRFIFFEKSKLEGRYDIDRKGYEKHIELVKDFINLDNSYTVKDKSKAIEVLQNLLYSFSAVTENRSWFAQSLLPICETALIAESMGVKKKTGDRTDREFRENIDNHFETNRYNFMCRGGEVYYLHLLDAINNNPEYKVCIENGFKKIIRQFNEFDILCKKIQKIWDEEIYENVEDIEKKIKYPTINKTLGNIPDGFKVRERKTLKELENILNSDMNAFEKLDILAYGMILQIIIMTYKQARLSSGKDEGYLIFDVNCYKGKSNEEVKKLATLNYNEYNQNILDPLYIYVETIRNKDKKGKEKTAEETINDAIEDSIKVYKKLGKNIGIIRPLNEKSARFTLNENILKFMVLSLIKPNSKMTFDRFIEKLYYHFGIVIGKEKLIEIDKRYNDSNAGFLDLNKDALQSMLKECGFLRELSDSTSIVENPYKEVSYE